MFVANYMPTPWRAKACHTALPILLDDPAEVVELYPFAERRRWGTTQIELQLVDQKQILRGTVCF